jgi:hypothetical protein
MRSASRAAGSALLALGLWGCSINIVRVKAGRPLDIAGYETLEVGTTTREEAVDRLGAPEKVEWKTDEDYLWWLYEDVVEAGIRFQVPPPPLSSVFGYRHNILRLSELSEDVSRIFLVFDEEGVLERKSLQLSRTYRQPSEGPDRLVTHIAPRFDHSFYVFGDGGARSYQTMFHDGFRAGLDLGFHPIPVATIFASGSYQEFQGDKFGTTILTGPPPGVSTQVQASADDLRLYQLELGLRLSAPLSLLWNFTDFDEVKRIFMEEDFETIRGFRIFLEAAAGGSYNEAVAVDVGGVPAGDLYDDGFGLTSTVRTGLEYAGKWGSIYVALTYQALSAFDEGDSPVDGSGDPFQAFFIGGGVDFRF